MERNVMGELNVYRGSGAKPNFSEIARRYGMDRHTVAKYWRDGESAVDGRSARGSAFDPLEEEIRAHATTPRPRRTSPPRPGARATRPRESLRDPGDLAGAGAGGVHPRHRGHERPVNPLVALDNVVGEEAAGPQLGMRMVIVSAQVSSLRSR